MELRTQEPARDIETREINLRQPGQGIYRQGNPGNGIMLAANRNNVSRGSIALNVGASIALAQLSGKQKRQWKSYSSRKKTQILSKTEKKVERRMRYFESDISAKPPPEKPLDREKYREIKSSHHKKKQIDRNPAAAAKRDNGIPYNIKKLQNIRKSCIQSSPPRHKRAPAVKKSNISAEQYQRVVLRMTKLNYKDIAGRYGKTTAQYGRYSGSGKRKKKSSEPQNPEKSKGQQFFESTQAHAGKKRHAQRQVYKERGLYKHELAYILSKDMQRLAQIRQTQKDGQIEAAMDEQEMRKTAVRIIALPVRVKAMAIRTKVIEAVQNTLKHIAAAAFSLLPVIVLALFLTSLVSGFAGEEEIQSGYGASGYEIVEYAKQWIGVTKYVWGAGRSGATSWQAYADCSSFTQGVFAHFGYSIGGTTYTQESAGTLVEGGLAEAMPGDIILFYSWNIAPGNSSHVGIYAGDGQMIHCSGGRANNSIANAGRGVCWGSPAADGRPFVVRRIVTFSSGAGITRNNRRDPSLYSQAQLELIWAIVAQEDNGSYEGALAVISSAMNRTESPVWQYCGSTALAQLTAAGQYCYSNDDYWRARLNGNVPAYVKQAVNDCLNGGIRNHSFTCFRSTKGSVTGPDAVQIGGNWYFGN